MGDFAFFGIDGDDEPEGFDYSFDLCELCAKRSMSGTRPQETSSSWRTQSIENLS